MNTKHAITFTLRQIKAHDPCQTGWRKLCRNLGGIKRYGLDTPITIDQIYQSNGYSDAMWALRTLGEKHNNILRHFAVDCAESVNHLLKDERSLKIVEVARAFADGKASAYELYAAREAARKAAMEADEDAAWGAARYAARQAAWQAAWEATEAAQLRLLSEYLRTGKRVMNAQEILKG